jgi:hypothetical protein
LWGTYFRVFLIENCFLRIGCHLMAKFLELGDCSSMRRLICSDEKYIQTPVSQEGFSWPVMTTEESSKPH